MTRRPFSRVGLIALAAALISVAGCDSCSDPKRSDSRADASTDTDGRMDVPETTGADTRDSHAPSDTTGNDDGDTAAPRDGSETDSGGLDAVDGRETGEGDSGAADTTAQDTAPADTAPADTPPTDTSSGDTGQTDTSTADASPTGLSVPCSNGSGWTVFKFHWSRRSGPSPRIDVWNASCSYSIASGSSCRISTVGTNNFTSGSPKAVLLSGTDVIRVRYDVSGLQFSKASVYVQARSYSTTASTYFQVWSPIYGGKKSPKRVDNDFVYDWYRVPWSNYLSPSDRPSLTAIEISDLGGAKLAVHAVELCVR